MSIRDRHRREHLPLWHLLCTELAARRTLMRIAVMQRKPLSYAMAIVATLIVLAVAAPVSATPLLPGLTVGVSLFTDDPGTLVMTPTPPPPVLASPVNPISGAYTGMLITAVYRDATGRLEFDYQFINNGPDDVHRITAFNFTGFATDVGYRLVPAGSPSVFAPPSLSAMPPAFADRDPDGTTVGFEFAPGPGNINAFETSVILAIKTDAPDRTDGFASVIDGGAQTVPAFQPTGTPIPPAVDVPEPATLLLVGSAVIGMGVTVRRRSQR
jgi:hypothetical protein